MLPGDYRSHIDPHESRYVDDEVLTRRPRDGRMSPWTTALFALVALAAAVSILVWLTAG